MILKMRHSHIEHNVTSDDGDVILAKGTAMVTLFMTSVILGTIPIYLNRWFNWNSNAKDNCYVKILLGFGGGVLMCTTFIHLLPEVSENFENLDLNSDVDIPYGEVLMCTGFFVMYFVEECVHVYLHQKQRAKGLKVISRNLSIRKCEKDTSDMLKDCETAQHHHADHSHVVTDISNNSTLTIIRGLLVVLALSIHELFEGLAVGLESSSAHVWYMFGAVSAHKLVIAFCIGVELVTSGLRTFLTVIYVFTFAVVSPLGIGIGMVISEEGESSTGVVSVFLQGLASGTLMYVVFFEILQNENKHGLKQYFSILFGFVAMFAITLIE